MGRKSNLGDGQRAEAVLALLRREEPAAVLARRYGVAEGTLYSWRDKFLAGGKAALTNGKGAGDPQAPRIQSWNGRRKGSGVNDTAFVGGSRLGLAPAPSLVLGPRFGPP